MRILATDFDNTLFRNREITREDAEAVARFRSAGNRFGLVTGRHLASIRDELARWDLPLDFVIACTGGILTDGQFHVLSEHRAPKAALVPLYEAAMQLHPQYFCVSVGLERFWFDVGTPPPEGADPQLPAEALEKLPDYHEMGTGFFTEDEAAQYTAHFNKTCPELLCAHQNGIHVDVCAPHTGKVSGLYEVLKLYGAQKDDLFVAGDNLNDLSMICEFSSFAMRDGRAELKPHAIATVESIAEIVKMLL